MPVIEKATDKSVDMYADVVLFNKIGVIEAIKWYKGVNLLPRDLARFSFILLHEGNWKTNGIFLDYKYYKDMLSPFQIFANFYGYL